MKRFGLCLLWVFIFCIFTCAQKQNDICPEISINTSNLSTKPNQIVIFTANLDGYEKSHKVGILWKVSEGEIVCGYGTLQIKVRQKSDFVLAYAEFTGLPNGCGNIVSTASINTKSPTAFLYKKNKISSLRKESFDKYNLNNELEIRPESKIFILVNFSFNASVNFINREIEKIIKSLSVYIPLERIIIAAKQKGKKLSEIWIVPAGAEFPSCESCKIMKGESLKELAFQN